jgi:hypothetical protein
MDAPAKISRKRFLKTAALASVGALPFEVVGSAHEHLQGEIATHSAVRLDNTEWRLDLAAQEGLAAELVHSLSGITLANGVYSFSFGSPSFAPASTSRQADASTVTLNGRIPGGIEIHHQFKVSTHAPWIEEQVTISNRGSAVLALPYGRCGFVLPLSIRDGAVGGLLQDFKFVAVPYRREPGGNRTQYADYTVREVLSECRRSQLRANVPVAQWDKVVVPTIFDTGAIRTAYPYYASEGWVLTDGRQGFLITKYSQEGMEWALLDRVAVDEEHVGLRWGGFGIYEGDPEHGAWIAPQHSHSFGTTRLTAFRGGLTEGFYTFRREMEARGHGCPKEFNPPVHWNELYDNKLWWLPDWGMDKPENRRKYYTLPGMRAEAAKARDIGCEALYLDPGWDTAFASKIWDESRLGPLGDFTATLRREFGLSLSLHTPLSGWCDPSSYAREIDRMNRDGGRVPLSLCGASRQYVDETLARLDALARGGAGFFMFDGTMCNGECWDPDHGHAVPSGRQEHVEATNRLARLVHERYPKLLIEMHDQMLGGTRLRYVPAYYGHGPGLAARDGITAPGFDSIWAFELMWDPMTDLVGGHSIALYYFNLAYSLPLYIHIDLRKDNAQCLMFWWNASTCRHLGIGGTHADPAVRQAHRDAMATYRRLERFFKRGTFFGIDEMTHVHVDSTRAAAVINCFNLEDHAARRSIEFDLAQAGLDARGSYEVRGGTAQSTRTRYAVDVEIPAYGHTLLELRRP